MKTLIAFSVLSLLCLVAYSQQHIKPTSKSKLVNIDSINGIISNHASKEIDNVDSATHAMYVQVLERTSNIQNNRDTYYSFIIAALTLLITGLAILFGYNWYSNHESHKKQIADLTSIYDESILKHENDLDQQAEQLEQKANQYFEAMANLQAFVETQAKAITEKDQSDHLKAELDGLKLLVEQLKDNASKEIGNTAPSASSNRSLIFRSLSKQTDRQYACRACKKNNPFEGASLLTNTTSKAIVGFRCQYCGNRNLFARK